MKKIYTIGRDESCDIVIPDRTDVVSRLHATIRIESGNKIFITDQSRNGTYVNGMKMSSNVEVPITRKDVISFAHVYNLDWSLIPKNRNSRYIILLLIILIIALISGGIWSFLDRRNLGKEQKVHVVDSVIVNKRDTIMVKDTIVIQPKNQDAVIQPNPDERKRKEKAKEPPTEVIDNNPIY